MVFLQRSAPNPRKRPAATVASGSTAVTTPISIPRIRDDPDDHIATVISLLAEAGCTLHVAADTPPSLPADLHKFRRTLESRLSSDPSLLPRLLSGLSSYINVPQNLRLLIVPASRDGSLPQTDSLARTLLLVPQIQLQLQHLLLEKLPEYFDSTVGDSVSSLKDDVARMIINQFRWLDFLVDSENFVEKLMEVLSISPPSLKKEIIGSLPEIIGNQSHGSVITALERLLQEDSGVIVPVLDSFSNLNLDEQLQEQAITIALACIRTVDGEYMPHLLRFLLLSATPANVRRIILQIREQLKFVGVTDPLAIRNKKLKGKLVANSTEASTLEALRLSLQFKNILCEAILKELKSLDHSQDHKVIDVWLIMLIYINGGSLQKGVEKILKKKVIEGCLNESLFDQCIHGHRELVKDHFSSFLSVSEYLMACREQQARDFSIYLYTALFEEFSDTFYRQEVLGSLVTHIGSGIMYEVSSALEAMFRLTLKYSEELIPMSSHINGILDYLEGFHGENLHKVYEIFCYLAVSARSKPDFLGSSIANELLMIVRKQLGNPDIKYRKMGIVGTLKIISTLGDVNAAVNFSSSQKTNCEEALELLKMAIELNKSATLSLILLYDELNSLFECRILQPAIIEWTGKHVGELESLFLSDLEGGQLPQKYVSNDIEGVLWMNLDGNLSPICLNILPLISSMPLQSADSLQILPSQFLLLSVVERLTNQGSLGGIDALLGCPLHLPSPRHLAEGEWKRMSGQQKQILCLSLYYAVNWIRELLNAFSTQVIGKFDCITQATRDETNRKLLKRLRNLVLLESLLNACLKYHQLTLPELHCNLDHSGTPFSKINHSKQRETKNDQSLKKRKHKDLTASEKLDPYGNLRQPTIVETLKKAGAVISQEVENRSSSGSPTIQKVSQCVEHREANSNELDLVDIATTSGVLDAQRCKFRPLLVDSLFMLSLSESQDNCCSDPAAELPLHLYLLRDLHKKLDYLNPPNRQFLMGYTTKVQHGHNKLKTSEFLTKIRPLSKSLRKHLGSAFSILKGSEPCQEHWKSGLVSAGSPDIPFVVVSMASVASSVFREVLCCYSKVDTPVVSFLPLVYVLLQFFMLLLQMLSIPDLFLQTSLPTLRDMLDAFQSDKDTSQFFSGLQPLPNPGSIVYLYCRVYSFHEDLLDMAYSLPFSLASEVLVTLQSILNSIAMLFDKSMEETGSSTHVGFTQSLLPFLRSKLASSAHKLLMHDWNCADNENELKIKGDVLQKILHIYLRNSESTPDLLDELACSILPQVPSCRTNNTQEAAHSFPTLCPTMFLTWYRVLHEENLDVLNKLVKGGLLKSRSNIQRKPAEVLIKLRQSVNVVVSLISMCKIHDKVAVHAIAVKYGGRFVDTFLKVFDFLEAHFKEHNDIIIQTVKELQKATRIIQTLCSEAKGSKRTMITSKIPATKRSMERFVFQVKALLHNTSNGSTFWMGNLKHKDLYGQVVSSQVYNNGDDDMDREAENNSEPDTAIPDDDHEQGDNDK
ncbi:fanconi anemia group D2 protein [Dioscorea alata]|uniref:Fanconi anemia group D2 protein n=1 Tax=Dioscorea alata TaxID=55571 RepID=A0ACB7UMR5_DIOAL|nr:fanconi anemia group D2 protein [Dioscorea alata]